MCQFIMSFCPETLKDGEFEDQHLHFHYVSSIFTLLRSDLNRLRSMIFAHKKTRDFKYQLIYCVEIIPHKLIILEVQ
jgi:hypothetical protein